VYLTRDEAAAELVKSGGDKKSAHAVLDAALRQAPQSVRTTFHMVTGYAKGTILGTYYPGSPGIPDDLFTIGRW
jgi:hypothetical protein